MTHKEAFRRYAIANIGKIRKRQEIREAVEQIRNDALTMDVSDSPCLKQLNHAVIIQFYSSEWSEGFILLSKYNFSYCLK